MNGRELMHASEIEMMQKLRERSDNLTRDNLNKSFAILDTNRLLMAHGLIIIHKYIVRLCC